jgi:hypothetical protein
VAEAFADFGYGFRDFMGLWISVMGLGISRTFLAGLVVRVLLADWEFIRNQMGVVFVVLNL